MTAIDQARGGPDGLNGKDAGDLLNLAGDVRRDLEAEQFGDALAAAQHLSDRADKLTKGVNSERARNISDAIDALIEAIPT